MRITKVEIGRMRSIVDNLRFLVGDQTYLAGFVAGLDEIERESDLGTSTSRAHGTDPAWKLGYADGLAGDIEPLANLVMRAHERTFRIDRPKT
jgi:hypothetical protein